ncbi:MAG: polymer-forming cytoskeletal protein [Pseudomonadota bacterium]
MLGNKKTAGGASGGGTTLISRDTVIVGDIRFSGTLDIEGLVQGNVLAQASAKALVRVVGHGRVEGDIKAPRVVINGSIQGDVHATEQLELASQARVQGNVYYAMVEMAAGAEVNGSLSHVAPDTVSSANEEKGPMPDSAASKA